jgi:hypothetical protein
MQLRREFRHFLLHEKKWWLLPMLAMALALALFLVVSATSGGSSFVYDIFG